jgi:hypothetical protein
MTAPAPLTREAWLPPNEEEAIEAGCARYGRTATAGERP